MIVAHADGSLVGEVGFHPNHLEKTMACFKSGRSGKVDSMPKQPIGRRAMLGAFVKARGHPKVVTNENGIASGVLERLQNGSGFSP